MIQRPATTVATEFRLLADQWRQETGMLSSVTRKTAHPAYQRIIELGMPVVPLILQELRDRPGYWFAALRAITGASVGVHSDLQSAAAAWLRWGEDQGFS